MSTYTTGELAKLCGVTVRTVQYYDTRNILTPSSLSEGGRRLYSDDDLRHLKIICALRELGLSIDNVARILSEKNSRQVISTLLEEQDRVLRGEIEEREAKLRSVEQMTQAVRSWSSFSVESIHDIAFTMEGSKKLSRVHGTLLVLGLIMDAIEIFTLILGITRGVWLPFCIGMPVVILLAVWLVRFYYRRTSYICPQCHTVFRPGMKEFFFAGHTMKTRKLHCPQCGYDGHCVETFRTQE
ncbi:MAG: MerR family transcriptional regulator [Oscillibacter sp.]|jgi:DNA-binding transcriptional MerR regulator/DNA-directed RNA polymerase subunit RPC12/RpoP|nr:MerR family transcriptional regulator [Oscillibacter sp.]